MFFVGAALFGGMILLPLYWQSVRHESVIVTGLLTAPQGIGAAMVMPVAGRLTDRFGGGPLALFGVLLTAVATIPFALIGPHTSIVFLCAVMVIRGVRDRLCLHAGDVGRVRVAGSLPSCRTPRPSSTCCSGSAGRSASPCWRSCCSARCRTRTPLSQAAAATAPRSGGRSG